MRLGILSDTHDRTARTKAGVQQLVDAGADVLIHCGDITIPDVVYELAARPSYFVFGNCDFDLDGLRKAIATIGGSCLEHGGLIELGGLRVAITHGDSDRELARLEAAHPDYLFTGHTHKALDVRRGPIRHINPGALQRASTHTVALLDGVSGHLELLHIIDDLKKS